MKKKILKLVVIMVTLGIPLINFAQNPFVTNGGFLDRWGRTNDPPLTMNDIRRIGIGNFSTYGGPEQHFM